MCVNVDVQDWRSTREGLVKGSEFKISFGSVRDAWKWIHAMERFPFERYAHDLWPVLQNVFGLHPLELAPKERYDRKPEDLGWLEW